jgi:protein-S-isoprenylcysteine O-methyltransferase Ste14
MTSSPTRRFRDHRSAMSALATTALLITMELSDLRRGSTPGDAVNDRGTAARFGAAMSVAITSSVVALSRPQRRPLPRHPRSWWAGIGLIWIGALVNRSARRELGRNYRAQLTIVDGHEVIESGPYRVVRHPMYSGAMMICLGCGLVVGFPASVAWALPAATLVHRVHAEEQLLRSALGSRYADFASGRPRLVPGLW